MLKDVTAVHYSRSDTRDLGYIDTNYWGFRFADRRSPFDLTADLAALAARPHLGLPGRQVGRPEAPSPTGNLRAGPPLAGVLQRLPGRTRPRPGCPAPATLTEATATVFVADFTRRVADGEPALGMFNMDGSAVDGHPHHLRVEHERPAPGDALGPGVGGGGGGRAASGVHRRPPGRRVRCRSRTRGRSATACCGS